MGMSKSDRLSVLSRPSVDPICETDPGLVVKEGDWDRMKQASRVVPSSEAMVGLLKVKVNWILDEQPLKVTFTICS